MDRLKEIQVRMSEIKTEIDKEDADLNALEKELDALKEERKGIMEKAEKRKKMMESVVSMEDAPVIKTFTEERGEGKVTKTYTTASPEYRSAFFKKMAEEKLNEVEERAFTHMTTNTEALLPKETADGIWNMIKEQHSILGDITIYRTGTVIEIVKHTEIVAGDAAQVAENAANVDEQNTFVKVTLSGKDFSKHVEVSYALGKMTAGSLEQYLTSEIAERLGAVLAKDVIAQVKLDMDVANVVATATDSIAWKEITGLFGRIKNAGALTVYVNNSTLYNKLVSITDAQGRPSFQTSMQEGAQGALLGAQVKIEEALGDNEILLGDPKKVVGNMIQDVMVEFDKDIKRHVNIYSGYARFEAALVAPKAFAQLNVTPAI